MDLSSNCSGSSGGELLLTANQVGGKVVFATCDLRLQATGANLTTTLVSDGNVSIQGTGTKISPAGAGLVALSITKNVSVTGAGLTIGGGLEAALGTITLGGASNGFGCHIVAQRLLIAGDGDTVNACA